MENGDGGRRYGAREASRILRRATDGELRSYRSHDGLTLEELTAAAREAGIDPEQVRRAALVRTEAVRPAHRILLGAPVSPTVRARVGGAVPVAAAAALGPVLDAALGRAGEATVEDGALAWREDHGFGRTVVRACSSGGGFVEIEGVADRQGHLLALVVGTATAVALLLLPLGGFGGLVALGGPLLVLVGPIAAVLAGTRMAWPLLQGSTERRLEAAVLEVCAAAEEARPAQGAGSTSADPEGSPSAGAKR